MAEMAKYAVEIPVPEVLLKRKKFKGKRLSVNWYASNNAEVTTFIAHSSAELAAVLPDQQEIDNCKNKEEKEALMQMSDPKRWLVLDYKNLDKVPFMNEVKNYTEMAQYSRNILQQLAHGDMPLTDIKGLMFVTAKHFLQQYVIEPMNVLKVALSVVKGESKDLTEAQTKMLSEDADMRDSLRNKMREGKGYDEAVALVMKEREKEMDEGMMRA